MCKLDLTMLTVDDVNDLNAIRKIYFIYLYSDQTKFSVVTCYCCYYVPQFFSSFSTNALVCYMKNVFVKRYSCIVEKEKVKAWMWSEFFMRKKMLQYLVLYSNRKRFISILFACSFKNVHEVILFSFFCQGDFCFHFLYNNVTN